VQEELGGLGGPHDGGQTIAGGVIEEVQGDSPETVEAGAEVLAVGEHHEHAVRVSPGAHVLVNGSAHALERQAHAAAGPPEADTTHRLIFAEDTAQTSPANELGDGSFAVGLVLGCGGS
jgi:hypothetical protein